MTAYEIYQQLNAAIPPSLSEEWDNDGLLCCPHPERPCQKALVTLDITEETVARAVNEGFDLILSHHPLIFRPLRALTPDQPVPRKLIKLTEQGITAMCFHTRLDALRGGVNDALAKALGVADALPFGEEGKEMGRIGRVAPCTLSDFAAHVKQALGTPFVLASGNLPVSRVALLGGEGDDFIEAAKKAGADTYVSGRLGYHRMSEAPEYGLNLIEAGHYYTERVVLPTLAALLSSIDGKLEIHMTESCPIRAV